MKILTSPQVLSLSVFSFIDWIRINIQTIPNDAHLNPAVCGIAEKQQRFTAWAQRPVMFEEDLFVSRQGTCVDQTEFMRFYLEKSKLDAQSWLLAYPDLHLYHSAITYRHHDGLFYMENAWTANRGLYKFSSSSQFLAWIAPFYANCYALNLSQLGIYRFPKPDAVDLTFLEYIEHAMHYPLTG